MTTPTDPIKRLAEKIYVLMFGNIAMDATPDVLFGIESLLAEAIKEATLGSTSTMHEDLYWQAGEIDRLTRNLKEARNSALEEAAKIAIDWPGPGGIIKVDDIYSPTDLMNSLRKGIVNAINALRSDGDKL